MVKSSRRGPVGFELNDSHVNLLVNQFSKSVVIGGDGHQAVERDNEPVLNWNSTSSSQPKAGPNLDSETPTIPAEAQSDVQVSHLKYSALGFEVDLTGSQISDTPFLLPEVENSVVMGYGAKRHRPCLLGVRRGGLLKAREDRFKKRRNARLRACGVVNKLLDSARQRLLMDLSLMVPGSIERIKKADPFGNGEVDWSILQSWLEGQPDLIDQLNLTTNALKMIATHQGDSLADTRPGIVKIYVFVAWKLDPGTYGEVCRFLLPDDDRFSPEELARSRS